MRIFTPFSKLAAVAALALACSPATAQMVSGNAFLKGNFIEVGSAPNGSFGSTVGAPIGYHPRVTTPMPGAQLGFVADAAKDGWTVGFPDYHGDFFLPGTPQEGWGIASGFLESQAYRQSGGGFTGPLSGANIAVDDSPTETVATWQGTFNTNLQITQRTRVIKSKTYFTVNVVMKNTGTTVMPDIYYCRTLDPDNDVSLTGSFVTMNKIEFAIPDPDNKVLVRAIDPTFAEAYLGLGTKDCRAKPFIHKSGLTPSHPYKTMYDSPPTSSYYFNLGDQYTNDVGISLVYKIGDIAAGDSVMITYAYILNQDDLEEALASTSATITVDTTNFIPGDTVSVAAGCGYCDTVNLSVFGAFGTEWHWYPAGVVLDTVGSNIQAVICEPTMVWAIGEGICGSDTLKLFFSPEGVIIPSPEVTPLIEYCQGDLAVPLTATGYPLSWWTDSTTTVPLPGAPTPNTSIPGTYSWWVSTSDSLCFSARVKITVLVKPKPATPILTAGPLPLCSGNALTLTATTTVPGVDWEITGPGGYTSNVSPSTIEDITAAQSGVYSAIASIDGCTSLPGTVNVDVNQTPSMPVVTYNDPVCDSSSLELHATTDVSPVTYVWSGPAGFVATTANPVIPSAVLGTNNGVYVATAFADGGCVSEAGSINVVIYPIPGKPLTDSLLYCQYSDVLPITATGDNLTWYTNATGKDTFLTAPTPQTLMPGVTTYYVSQTVNTCESDRSTLIVTIDPKPVASLILVGENICAGSQVKLNLDINAAPTTSTWDFGDGTSLSGVTNTYHSYENEGTYTAALTLTFDVCPDTTVQTTINVKSVPHIDLGRDTAMCPNAGPIVLMDYMNAGDGNATWLWNTGETSNNILARQPGVYWSTVTVGECSATDSVEVRKDCYMDMPNVFTPNGDGTNDYFFPRQELTSSMAAFKMTVFNRWGEKVFETSSINGRGWDGRYNGKDQPQGVYIYQVQAVFLDGHKENLNGNVTLLR